MIPVIMIPGTSTSSDLWIWTGTMRDVIVTIVTAIMTAIAIATAETATACGASTTRVVERAFHAVQRSWRVHLSRRAPPSAASIISLASAAAAVAEARYGP